MKNFVKLLAPIVAATVLSLSLPAVANVQLASDYGCLNCHGAYQRSEAPSVQGLADKLAKYQGDAVAEAKFVTKYHTGAPLEHIEAHERISVAAATRLVHWLVEGGK